MFHKQLELDFLNDLDLLKQNKINVNDNNQLNFIYFILLTIKKNIYLRQQLSFLFIIIIIEIIKNIKKEKINLLDRIVLPKKNE